jgi:hypothetical protein
MHAPTVEVPRRLELPDRPGPEVLKNVLGQMAAFWKTEHNKTRVTTNREISVFIKTTRTHSYRFVGWLALGCAARRAERQRQRHGGRCDGRPLPAPRHVRSVSTRLRCGMQSSKYFFNVFCALIKVNTEPFQPRSKRFSKNTRVPCSQTPGLVSTPALRLSCVDVQIKITDIMCLRLLANSVQNRALAPYKIGHLHLPCCNCKWNNC